MKNRKIWIGVGAFFLAGSGGPFPVAASDVQAVSDVQAAAPEARHTDLHARLMAQAAATFGQAGEGGEGGEAGIDAEAAATDPVQYGVALQVIAAHFHAGLAAYEGKEQEAGAQMFAHGLSEVYVAMEDVFKKLGVRDLGPKLEAAVAAAVEKKPVADVKRKAKAVFSALAAAERKGPTSKASAQAVQAKVAAELLDRAAAQYAVVQKDQNLEAYLDGLGFAIAARKQAKSASRYLKGVDSKKEAALRQAVTLAGQAYPGINRPAQPRVSLTELQSSASAARLAVSNLP
ncbi:hypothetical protein [Pseudorhodoplanes sp.]|uniref:hypothetical protein n=1 Tax=Pseudorhodoplanes sp. TaxID=1934341 RepID=UPI003D10D51F